MYNLCYINAPKTQNVHPLAPLGKADLELSLEKKLYDVNSFKNSVDNIKEMITYFNEKNNQSKKKYKKYKMLTTILKSFDRLVKIATTSSSITTSLTRFVLIVVLISTAVSCGLTISNKILHEIVSRKKEKLKNQYQKDQQTKKSFDKLYRKSLQDIVNDENEYKSLCKIFTQYLDETKNESFHE